MTLAVLECAKATHMVILSFFKLLGTLEALYSKIQQRESESEQVIVEQNGNLGNYKRIDWHELRSKATVPFDEAPP